MNVFKSLNYVFWSLVRSLFELLDSYHESDRRHHHQDLLLHHGGWIGAATNTTTIISYVQCALPIRIHYLLAACHPRLHRRLANLPRLAQPITSRHHNHQRSGHIGATSRSSSVDLTSFSSSSSSPSSTTVFTTTTALVALFTPHSSPLDGFGLSRSLQRKLPETTDRPWTPSLDGCLSIEGHRAVEKCSPVTLNSNSSKWISIDIIEKVYATFFVSISTLEHIHVHRLYRTFSSPPTSPLNTKKVPANLTSTCSDNFVLIKFVHLD